MKALIFTFLGTLLCFSSCQKWEGGNKPPKEIALTRSEAAIASQTTLLTFNLLDIIDSSEERGEGNMMISPLSLSLAMAMCRNGADGDTKTQIEEGLQMADEGEGVNSYFKKMSNQLKGIDKKSTLHIANSIWYKNSFPVKESFLNINQEWFNAQVTALDFASPEALSTINSWCSRNTNGKIESILEEISQNEVMFLINALYFKAPWQDKFSKEKTADRAFTLKSGAEINVPTMNGRVNANYIEDNGVKALTIPFGNGAFKFTVVLSESITTTLTSLQSTTLWQQIASQSSKRKVNLYLPKFKFEWKINFNEIVKELGVVDAFSATKANFSEVVEGATNGQLVISKVLQKTFIEINEEGGEAAAVTSVGMELTAAPEDPVTFRADRPFIFLIWEQSTASILFAGEVLDPSN